MNWKHFKREEFACPCCGENHIKDGLIDILDEIRKFDCLFNFKITSGYRCPIYNTTLGGGPAHPKGVAADIYVKNNYQRFFMLDAFLKYFNRIGVGKDFIHVDLGGDDLPSPRLWVY